MVVYSYYNALKQDIKTIIRTNAEMYLAATSAPNTMAQTLQTMRFGTAFLERQNQNMKNDNGQLICVHED